MKLLTCLVVSAVMIALAGCEFDESKYNDLKFDNASRFTVSVNPLTTEWSGFSLAPGEKRSFGDINNPDFSWEPLSKVDLGSSSTDRRIIFVDRAKELPVEPTVIIVTNVTDSRR